MLASFDRPSASSSSCAALKAGTIRFEQLFTLERSITTSAAGTGALRRRVGYPALLAALSSLPYFFAWSRRPAGAVYDWVIPPYPEDGLAYLAWVRQAANGALLFKLKYTALPQTAVVFQPLFLFAGWLCRAFAIGPGLSLFALRIVGIGIFAAALEDALDAFRFSPFAREFSFALVAVSSGLGAFVPASLRSADLWLVDLDTLWSLSWNPLFPWALALVLFIVTRARALADSPPAARSALDPLLLGGALGLLAFVHPYDLLVSGPLAAAILFARRHSLSPRVLLAVALALVPAIALQGLLSIRDPLLAQHAAQGAMSSPPLGALLLGLGIPGVLAIVGAYVVLDDPERQQAWPLVAWAALSLLLCHLPIWFQRKLLFGVHLPSCLLAALAIERLVEAASVRAPRIRGPVIAGFVLLVAISAATQVVHARALPGELQADRAAYYVPLPLADALEFLRGQGAPDAVVLAAPATSRLIPGLSGNTALYGHWAQAVDAGARMAWLAFLLDAKAPMTDAQRLAELRRVGVRYLLLDRDGRAFLGPLPAWLRDGSQPVFHEGEANAADAVEVRRLAD